jgi:PII-like signaling protein
MTHGFRGERTLMRIFIGESDKCGEGRYRGKPLHEALLNFFLEEGLPGATVVRGIAGFGAQGRVHTDKILRLSLDLPIIVEVVATEEQVQELLPQLDRMIDGGLITLERVRVILYRPHSDRE